MNRPHKKLDVWRESIALATHVYEITEAFPKSEIYGLASQMRRAAVSVGSNIAEGAARFSNKEFAQFLNIAGGSLSELDTQIEIAFNLNYINVEQREDIDQRIGSITGKLGGLISIIRKKIKEQGDC